ncbi:MAG: hypothetical protein ACKO63_19080 [Nodosilinea sp.]
MSSLGPEPVALAGSLQSDFAGSAMTVTGLSGPGDAEIVGLCLDLK